MLSGLLFCLLGEVKVCGPVPLTALWPASWVAAVDKTRCSKSAEVRGVWEVYDKALEFVRVDLDGAIGDALGDGDVTAAWAAWFLAAEQSLSRAFLLAGGPVPPGGLVKARGSALLSDRVLGGKRVRRLRRNCAGDALSSEVHLFRVRSLSLSMMWWS